MLRPFTATISRSGRCCAVPRGKSGDVLEAGSGTGQHVVHFARHTPGIVWWPSDLNEQHLKSIEAWRAHAGLPNIRPPHERSTCPIPTGARRCSDGERTRRTACGVLRQCHPYRAVARRRRAVRRRGRAICTPDGLLFLYGPFKRDGKHTAVSNAVFDTSLRESNPEWGVRDIADLEATRRRTRPRVARERRDAGQQLIWCSAGAQPGLTADAWPAPVGAG